MMKMFEQFKNEEEIKKICKEYYIEDYAINSDGSIDVNGDIHLEMLGIKKIPLKFNIVSGDFYCFGNKLSSLEGCPKFVGGYFDCSINKITSLIYGPEEVKYDFSCSYNKITSLKGGPIIINGGFMLEENPIKVIDCSIKIGGVINIYQTKLDIKIISLEDEHNEKLRILFEHGVDYDIFKKDGSINDSRLERMFKDFNI